MSFIYLAVIMDVFTRSIRGWHLGRFLDDAYMHKQLHSSLGYLTPVEHETAQM